MLQRRLVIFILGVAAIFVIICNGIPQIKVEAAVVGAEIGETPEELIAAGKRIFTSDHAQCLTCHSLGEDPKARCPNQEGLGQRAPTRRPGLNAAQYLVESTYNPNAFIVPGYPKNQMTPINKPPIALSHDEIFAVITFLNSLGGSSDAAFVEQVKQAQEPWRKGLLKPTTEQATVNIPIFPGDVARGRKLFTDQGCINCHRVGSAGRDVCPDLTSIGSSQSPEYIIDSILDPSKVIVKGYTQINIVWDEDALEDDEEDLDDIRGTPIKWIPSKEQPTELVVGLREGLKVKEVRVDLHKVLSLGDTWVGLKEDEGSEPLCGELLERDADGGLTLSEWKEGHWAKRHIAKAEIEFINQAQSPMPANFAEEVTAGELYDLLAFLRAQKGERATP